MGSIEYESRVRIVRGRRREIAITITTHVPPFPATSPHLQLAEHRDYKGIWYLLYTGAIVIMYPSLVALAQLKFQDNKLSPFETHSFFAYTAIVAYTIAIPTSMILFYMRTRLETSIKECFSLSYYMYKILKNVFCFFVILAPLSLVLVVLIPHGYNWIGYSTIASLSVIIVACNFSDYVKLLCKKSVAKLGVLRRDETSPCSGPL